MFREDLGEQCSAVVELADLPRVPALFYPDLPADGVVTMTGVALERS